MQTVLLIDDDPTICRSVGRLLRFMGFQVLIASSGAEALEIAERIDGEHQIDLVLSDVQMSDMSGHEVAAAFAERYPVVLMSGALKQQVSGILAKPFTPNELLQHIQSALRVAA
ncbi:MAG: CheY-like chemotaxis protein [Myxococcota bacterium]|jgi:CheY-like chemotaxis protein